MVRIWRVVCILIGHSYPRQVTTGAEPWWDWLTLPCRRCGEWSSQDPVIQSQRRALRRLYPYYPQHPNGTFFGYPPEVQRQVWRERAREIHDPPPR